MVIKFDRYFSPAGENRGIHLYLPDDYYESQERYPVLYMFDGHNLFFDSDATSGHCIAMCDGINLSQCIPRPEGGRAGVPAGAIV